MKDAGYQGLNGWHVPDDGTGRTLTAAAMFSLVVPAYAQKYGVDEDELKMVLATISAKNHFNGARNPVETVSRDDAEAFCEKLTGTNTGS